MIVYARLLKEAGFVAAFSVANIDESIFMLSSIGFQAVAEAVGVERDQLKWAEAKVRPKDYYFMQHFLAINDFRIQLSLECNSSGVKILGFIPDYYGEKVVEGNVRKYIRDAVCDITQARNEVSHTPDGVFALERKGKKALFFLEIDRGTEVVSDMSRGVLKALHFYSNYLLEGKYNRYAKDFEVEIFRGFRVLFITTSALRVTNIRNAASVMKVPGKAKQFIWLSTFEKINDKGVFGPAWESSDMEDKQVYQIG